MAIRLLIEVSDTTTVVELTNRAFILGRSSKADLRLNDGLISGQHCEITLFRNSEINIRDLESTNGTYINGSKIISQKFFIGDILTLGKHSISIDIKALSPKEYKAFYNAERTSIRFIDAGLKTKSIQHNIYEETKKSIKSKSKEDINFNIESTTSKVEDSLADAPQESPGDEQKTDISSNDCEFGFQHPSISKGNLPSHTTSISSGSDKSLSLMESSVKDGYQSSGSTQFIKLSEKTGTKHKYQKNKAQVPKRKKKIEKKKSFLEKLFSFLK